VRLDAPAWAGTVFVIERQSTEMRMKHLCVFLLFSASLYPVRAQERIKPEDATHAIIKAFESHSIVMIGEVHGNKQEYEFLRSLVASPGFEDRVDDLVLEYGNSLYQDIVDRYVAGDRVPIEEVQKAWRNTTAIGPPSPVYSWLYEAVRGANTKHPQGHRMRIVLGDVYIDWNQVKTREDLGPFVANRDPYYASVVKDQVISQHRRALLIMGFPHFLRSPAGPGLIEKELRAAGATTFVIVSGTNAVGQYDDLDKRFDSWTFPSIAPLGDNWVGRLPALPVIAGGTSPPITGGTKLEDVADAILYLGPRDSLIQLHTTRADLQGTAYGREIDRRLEIMFGTRVDVVSEKAESPQFPRNPGPPPPLPPPPRSIRDPLPPKPHQR
jgi:hypothetical protein